MKWIRYELRGKTGYGLVEGEKVAEYEGVPYGEHKKTGNHVRMADIRVLYPLVPPTFYAAGLNYITHRKKNAERTGTPLELPKQQDIGYRANNALISPGEAIVIPAGLAGVAVASLLFKRMSREALVRAVEIVLLVTGVSLVARSFSL